MRNMIELKRFYNYNYDRCLSAVAMDERFLMLGQIDGHVSVHYLYNGIRAFNTKISEKTIVAVCCEDRDDVWNELFYAADSLNKIFVLNKLGEVVASGVLDEKLGHIHTLVNPKRFSINTHTLLGTRIFNYNKVCVKTISVKKWINSLESRILKN